MLPFLISYKTFILSHHRHTTVLSERYM